MKNIAIILASGSGSRFLSNTPKQFCKVNNKTLIEYSIEAFENNKQISKIIIVTNPNYINETKNIISNNKYKKISKVVAGGATRQKSSYNGVFSVNEDSCNVLIHDAARPFVTQEIINNCINALKDYNAINVAIKATDTIIEINDNNIIKKTLNRDNLMCCQTPQCFNIDIIKEAHTLALKDKYSTATDDCSLVLKYELADIYVVQGSNINIKITYPEDINKAITIVNSKSVSDT